MFTAGRLGPSLVKFQTVDKSGQQHQEVQSLDIVSPCRPCANSGPVSFGFYVGIGPEFVYGPPGQVVRTN